MTQTFFEWLTGIENKTLEQIKQENEQDNESNYRVKKMKVINEAEKYKEKHKIMIEFRLKKDIELVTLKDLFHCGFNSPNITRKHAEEFK